MASVASPSRWPTRLNVTAPSESGRCRLLDDLVQEEVAWFSERGSVAVSAETRATLTAIGLVRAAVRVPFRAVRRVSAAHRFARLVVARSRVSRASETAHMVISDEEMLDMNGIPHDEVVHLVESAGADVVDSGEDGCAGPDWRSYTYFAVKRP